MLYNIKSTLLKKERKKAAVNPFEMKGLFYAFCTNRVFLFVCLFCLFVHLLILLFFSFNLLMSCYLYIFLFFWSTRVG